MAYSNEGKFTLPCDNVATMKPYRFVAVDAQGEAVLPDASSDASVLGIVGVSDGQPTLAGDITVRGFDGGVHKVGVAASQTVAAGSLLYLTSTAGCVATASSGEQWLVGVALAGATSGAQEIAVIPAVLCKPVAVDLGT